MYFCYLDESGTTELNSGTSHFVLLGLAIPIGTWQSKDRDIDAIKRRFQLEQDEIHCGWMTRRYLEQERIANFPQKPPGERRSLVLAEIKNSLIRVAATKPAEALRSAKKNYAKITPYIHLTRDERFGLLRQITDLIGTWSDATIFFEAADKAAYRRRSTGSTGLAIEEESFTQVVSRFQHFLRRANSQNTAGSRLHGVLVQDNNETVAKKLTTLMRHFYRRGTAYTMVPDMVETPLFVDSGLTNMVQLVDVCAYSVRRFFENGEEDLFNRIYQRCDRYGNLTVGARHYTGAVACRCRVCVDHGRL